MVRKKDIRRKMSSRGVDVIVGKNGLTEGIENEIKRRLETSGMIKVRLLKSARAKVSDEDMARLAERIGAVVGEVRGYTYVLVRVRGKKRSRSISAP